MKKYFYLSVALFVMGCSSSSEKPVQYNVNVGDCIEEPFGIYTYKVMGVDKNIVTAKPIGGLKAAMVRFDLNRQQLGRVSCP